jgi:hypothetical protein
VLCAVAACLFSCLPSLPQNPATQQQSSKGGSGVQEQPTLPGRTLQPGTNHTASAEPRPAILADLAWLEGRWRGDWGPRLAEQIWTAAKADLMLGTFRLVEGNKTLLIEVLTLSQTGDDIDFRFRHFTPDLAPWEKSGATTLILDSFDSTRFVFANPLNGEPKHAILTRIGQDTFISRFEIVPSSGEIQIVEITYHRQKQPRT